MRQASRQTLETSKKCFRQVKFEKKLSERLNICENRVIIKEVLLRFLKKKPEKFVRQKKKMGKLVKYCSECEEGFAERFGFCPNCGGQLEVFEMNPIAAGDGETERRTDGETKIAPSLSPVVALSPVVPAVIPETVDFSGDDILELDAVDTRDEETLVKETEVSTTPAIEANGFQEQTFAAKKTADTTNNDGSDHHVTNDSGDYHITVVSGKPNNWFAPFLLGLMSLAFLSFFAVWAASVWINGMLIPELTENDIFYSMLTDDEPTEMEEIEPKKGKKGGGGGGGGNENEEEASRGRTPTHSDVKNQIMIAPRFDSDLKIRNTIQSKVNEQDDGQQVGIGQADGTSAGSGKGKGVGKGFGDGFGDGVGDGRGKGKGKGSGNGVGEGIGDGVGNDLGNDKDDDQPKLIAKVKPQPTGETKKISIISKPPPRYTDAARQNNVQGNVTLRVTFNANGTIGAITPVSQLPYGLTEQAISAARRITFQPAMKNGQPQSVTMQVVFNFTIY